MQDDFGIVERDPDVHENEIYPQEEDMKKKRWTIKEKNSKYKLAVMPFPLVFGKIKK